MTGRREVHPFYRMAVGDIWDELAVRMRPVVACLTERIAYIGQRRVKSRSKIGAEKGSMDKYTEVSLHGQVEHRVVGVVGKCRVLVPCPGNLVPRQPKPSITIQDQHEQEPSP